MQDPDIIWNSMQRLTNLSYSNLADEYSSIIENKNGTWIFPNVLKWMEI